MTAHSCIEPVFIIGENHKSVKILPTKKVPMFILFPCDWTVSKSPHSHCYPRNAVWLDKLSMMKRMLINKFAFCMIHVCLKDFFLCVHPCTIVIKKIKINKLQYFTLDTIAWLKKVLSGCAGQIDFPSGQVSCTDPPV